jgi:hypothetical protein
VLVFAVFTPPANVPLAPPLNGAVKVTTAPLTGLLPASVTVTCNAVANGWPTVALCGVPAVAVILAGEPVKFVSENVAGFDTPVTEALTW